MTWRVALFAVTSILVSACQPATYYDVGIVGVVVSATPFPGGGGMTYKLENGTQLVVDYGEWKRILQIQPEPGDLLLAGEKPTKWILRAYLSGTMHHPPCYYLEGNARITEDAIDFDVSATSELHLRLVKAPDFVNELGDESPGTFIGGIGGICIDEQGRATSYR